VRDVGERFIDGGVVVVEEWAMCTGGKEEERVGASEEEECVGTEGARGSVLCNNSEKERSKKNESLSPFLDHRHFFSLRWLMAPPWALTG